MKIKIVRRWRLAPAAHGAPQVTYRSTEFGTIMLRDEFRTVEMMSPGVFVGGWGRTAIPCTVPNHIRRAAMKAYVALAA